VFNQKKRFCLGERGQTAQFLLRQVRAFGILLQGLGLERQGALEKSALPLTGWDIWCPSGYEGSNPSPYNSFSSDKKKCLTKKKLFLLKSLRIMRREEFASGELPAGLCLPSLSLHLNRKGASAPSFSFKLIMVSPTKIS